MTTPIEPKFFFFACDMCEKYFIYVRKMDFYQFPFYGEAYIYQLYAL